MQGTHRIPLWFAILMGLASIFIIFIGFAPFIFSAPSESNDILLLFFLISLPLLALGTFCLIEVFYSKIVIEENRIYSKGLFNNYSFSFDEIIGFNKTQNYVSVFSGKKRMRISKYVKDIDKLHNWFGNYFVDLDALKRKNDNQKVEFEEEVFSEAYHKKLKIAKYVTYFYNALAYGSAAWIFFYPSPYTYSVLFSIVVVLLGVLLPKFSKGFIGYADIKEEKKANVTSLFIPALGLSLRAFLDVNVFDYSTLWLLIIALTIPLMTFMFVEKEFNLRKGKTYIYVVFFLYIFSSYSFGAILLTNVIFDDSTPKIYKAKIIDKRIGSGDVTTYSFDLDKWHETSDMNDIQVSEDMYYELEKNDSVTIYLQQGKFGIPWLIPY